MFKMVVFILLMAVVVVRGAAQPAKSRTQLYSFDEVVNYLKSRGYTVGYQNDLVKEFPPVGLMLPGDGHVEGVLKKWLAGLQFNYDLRGRAIQLVATYKMGGRIYKDICGLVTDAASVPVSGASVSEVGTNNGTRTDTLGHFCLPAYRFISQLEISHVGFVHIKREVSNKYSYIIRLESSVPRLDEVIVVPFGLDTRRYTTASVAALSKEARHYPDGSLLGGMQGRVPGLYISDMNGLGGSAKKVSLGGRHSIQQVNSPLVIVDGVPLATDGFLPPPGTGSAFGKGGEDILNFIMPDNVAGTSILKDAAATSVFGSRGSNGVILITLDSGRRGPMQVSFNVNYGIQGTVKRSPLLTTPQFLQLRKEAAMKDGLKVDSISVPEAYVWDTARQADFRRLTTGNPAYLWNAGVKVTGGNDRGQYLFSGQVHRESTVFPGATSDQRASFYVHLNNRSANRKFQMGFSGMYTWDGNHLPVEDYTAKETLARNAPSFINKMNQADWGGKSPLPFVNIPALANNDYFGNVYTVFGHVTTKYKFSPHFSLEENLGFNGIQTSELAYLRYQGQDPDNYVPAKLTAVNNRYSHIMTETIARWKGCAGKGHLEVLVGGDYQERHTHYSTLTSSGYRDDLSLNQNTGATDFTYLTDQIPYYYFALFGRARYDLDDRYVLDASWRYDGSSRLGSAHRAGNFMALSGAYIFSQEGFLRDNPILSFGKVRGSIGTTSNEPAADGLYNQLYQPAGGGPGYQGQQGVMVNQMGNPNLRWELNYRADVALELGFLNDRLQLSAGVSRSWTANQLVTAPINPVAGLSIVQDNVDGINVQNTAVELTLEAGTFTIGQLGIAASAMLTVPRNKLVSWPGLDSGRYSTKYVIGKPLSAPKAFHWTGVDSSSGLYTFTTHNANGNPTAKDLLPSPGFDPKYYLGWSQRISWGENLTLELLFDYRRQRGTNPLFLLAQQNPPGSMGVEQLSNGPVEWLDHWRKPGDISKQQRLTMGYDRNAMTRLQAYLQSDAKSIDASYLRLRSFDLNYRLPGKVAKQLGLVQGNVYVRGQNLWTRSHFPVTDAETQDPSVLPPMRILQVGFHIIF